ncbi:MAG: FG-GAP-like repeat-containing protein [Rubripirellula sp.]
MKAPESGSDATSELDDAAPLDRMGKIDRIDRQLEQGKFAEAMNGLQSLLLADPNDVEVIFRLATLQASRGELGNAIESLDAIPADDPEAGLPALGQSADWSLQLGQYSEAERRYQAILDRLPEVPEVHRKLAQLFNRQGRRHEAAEHIEHLCRLGNVRNDELHALIHLSDAMYDDPSTASQQSTDVQYFPIGSSAVARKLFMEENYAEALLTLREDVTSGNVPPSIFAFYGRVAAEAQDDEAFHQWLGATNDEHKAFAEYWAAVGTFQMLQGQSESAIRSLLEAVDRDPTDLRSIGRLRSLFESLGNTEASKAWEDRWKALRRTLRENNSIAESSPPNAAAMIQLSGSLSKLGRVLEATLWRMLAAHYQKMPPGDVQQLNAELRSLIASGGGLPTESQRLCGLPREMFSIQAIEQPKGTGESLRATSESAVIVPPHFRNVSDKVGLEHSFQVASVPHEYGFSVYQSIGGAVVALDYDLDGRADLYFAQGGCDAPDFIGTQSNLLYRSVDGELRDVTLPAAADENRYSIGATSGDWNQDGFPDIVLGNLGSNVLLLNNGDGTFARSTLSRDKKTLMTTSLALADLTGDQIPDLYEVVYLDDPDLAERPVIDPAGTIVKSMNPMDFRAGQDRVLLRDQAGDGNLRVVGEVDGEVATGRAGLGIVVSDFDGLPGNEVFVANDLYPNQLWAYQAGERSWSDQAMLRGCAHGFNGGNTASMGVAAGDLTGNGMLDLHVTNFQNENVSLYLNENGTFQDRNVQYGLGLPTAAVLGFGTQAVDYDNDGDLDLMVTNGHIEKASDLNAPFAQPSQLFVNLGSRFQLTNVADESGYWGQPHVGRALARLDFNRDGRMDVAITHLGERSALLINETQSNNHWIQLQLIGVDSERDAIGAKVEVVSGDQRFTEWVNAGDGFLSRNEAVVTFGLGSETDLQEVRIRWPSGKVQVLSSLEPNKRWVVIEGQPVPFAFEDSNSR